MWMVLCGIKVEIPHPIGHAQIVEALPTIDIVPMFPEGGRELRGSTSWLVLAFFR